jgi:hypothetical protein
MKKHTNRIKHLYKKSNTMMKILKERPELFYKITGGSPYPEIESKSINDFYIIALNNNNITSDIELKIQEYSELINVIIESTDKTSILTPSFTIDAGSEILKIKNFTLINGKIYMISMTTKDLIKSASFFFTNTTFPWNIPLNKISDQYDNNIDIRWHDGSKNVLNTIDAVIIGSTQVRVRKTNTNIGNTYAIKISLDTNPNNMNNYTLFVGLSSDLNLDNNQSDNVESNSRNGLFVNAVNGQVILRKGGSDTTLISSFDGFQSNDNFKLTIIEHNNKIYLGSNLNNLREFNNTLDGTERHVSFIHTYRRLFGAIGESLRLKLYSPLLDNPGP